MNILRLFCLLLGVIVSFCASSQSCYTADITHYSFRDVTLILDKNKCNSCHFTNSKRSSWNYTDYESIFKVNSCGYPIITPGKSASSSLIEKLNGGPTACGFAMPLGLPTISNQDLLAIESWINVGAPENCVVSYSDIKYILDQKKCNSCHNGAKMWSYDTYENMFLKPEGSLCPDLDVVKYNAANSLLYNKLNHDDYCGFTILDAESRLTALEVASIRDWINAGAPLQKGVLPIQLSDFGTRNVENTYISIFWATETEQNTEHYELEHSTDGISYRTIATFKTQHLANESSYYSYRHTNVSIGFNYYRLRFFDLDDRSYFSAVRIERVKNNFEVLNLMPNPIARSNELKVEWYPLDQRTKSQITFCNFLGYEVKKVSINFGINTINTEDLLPGLYYLTIQDYGDGILFTKLMVL